jgi:hypothetical protein
MSYEDKKAATTKAFQYDYLYDLMKAYRGNVTHAAVEAGTSRSALQRLLRKAGLKGSDFRDAGHAVELRTGALRSNGKREPVDHDRWVYMHFQHCSVGLDGDCGTCHLIRKWRAATLEVVTIAAELQEAEKALELLEDKGGTD